MFNFKKHPKALPFLFLSEMWERFGYYLMIGIFTLYLKDAVDGFVMTESEASDLYGTFIAFVFLTPFIGGLLADRVLGYRLSINIGGLMMGAGYCLMAVHELNTLYIAMFLVIMGNGFFKPNISSLLGNLYNNEQYKNQKDEGYNIFYMGINIGAFVCKHSSAEDVEPCVEVTIDIDVDGRITAHIGSPESPRVTHTLPYIEKLVGDLGSLRSDDWDDDDLDE